MLTSPLMISGTWLVVSVPNISCIVWFQRYNELRALIEQKVPPTFFWTVSSADTFWSELHDLLPHPAGITPQNARICAIINNPHITDWFFYTKLTDWVQHWLYDALGADWHWYRFEYQACGSTHAHGCAKLSNDPGICGLIQKVALAWNISDDANSTVIQPDERAHILQEGEKAKIEVLSYCDWLVTTCNDALPDELWFLPNTHPCIISIRNEVDLEEDYHNLTNSVQRHTRSAAYCLKKKSGQQTPQCRFSYPRPTQTESTIEFEKLGDGIIRATLLTKRNDPRLNSHSRLLLQNWRANVDLQIVVDVHACARYMAKYVAKAEPRSKSVSDIFTSCVQPCPEDESSRSALRRAMIRAVGERDFSAQETAHMLLSLPLISCTFSFYTLSLTGCRKVIRNAEMDEISLHRSILDLYGTRDTNLELSLLQFASQFMEYKGELKKRSTLVIVRAFPFYSSDPLGENYNLYCKYQLIKHLPWVGQSCNAWNGGDGTPSQWIQEYHRFLQTDTAMQGIPNFNEEIQRSQQRLEEEADSEDEPEGTEEIQDEWMQLCQLNPRFNMPTETASNVDWAASARELPSSLLRECPHWISSQRQAAEYNHSSPWLQQLPTIDVATLNPKQLQAYHHIKSHYFQYRANHSPPPLYMIVSGTASTGKSYLISAITHLLNNSCVITVTTGMASFNICGKTQHSTLKLPVRKSNHRDLQGASLQQLQLQMRGKHYIIIDEMSMIGHRMMAWIDKRIRQASGKLDCPLGGFSIILFGDFGQLPPVGDRPLYTEPTSNDVAQHGHHIYSMFNTVVILDQVLRQHGASPEIARFRDLLLRLRNGCVTEDDWKLLLTRDPSKLQNSDDFKDAIRLFYDKENVARYNLEKLQSLPTPVARIHAVHNNSSATCAKPDDAGGLYPTVFVAVDARVMLTANLWPEIGNGAAGNVHDILYQENHQPPNLSIAVLVIFDHYSGPSFLYSSIQTVCPYHP